MLMFQTGAKLAFQRLLRGAIRCEGLWERSLYVTSVFNAKRGYHWKQPEGVDTGIVVYNHSTKSKVPLVLQTEGNLKWYVCGPTVYDESHIGHACCFVRFDIIRRILSRIFNINVVYVMNITDISEQVIQRSQQVNQPAEELANHYTDKFLNDLKRLNVLPPIMPSVSKNISAVIKFIERLIQDEKAYVTSQGNVYFRCRAYALYGSFSGGYSPSDDSTDNLGDKEAAEDFALWKAQKAGEPNWDSPWSKGHPGWHIECSAIASEMLGSCIDIHSGGADLKFPHHENEMAQSCCYHKTEQWVNYWIYSGLLRMANDSEKMSKSLGNVLSVDELLQKYSANQFRVFCLLSSYGNDIEFGEEQMRKASKIHKKLTSIVGLANSYINDAERSQAVNGRLLEQSLLVTQKVVKKSLSDNFNTAAAVAAIMNLVHVCNIELSRESPAAYDKQVCPVNAVAAIVNYIQTIMSDLGVSVSPQQVQTIAGSQEHADQLKQIVDSAVSFREKVRNYCLAGQLTGLSEEEKARVKAHRKEHASLMDSCDQLRQELSSLCSITIQDGKDGKSLWSVEESQDE